MIRPVDWTAASFPSPGRRVVGLKWEVGHRDCPGHLQPPTPNNRQSSTDRPTSPPPPPPPSQFFWKAEQTRCCLSCWRQVRRFLMPDGCPAGKVSLAGRQLTCRAAFLGRPTMGAAPGARDSSRPQPTCGWPHTHLHATQHLWKPVATSGTGFSSPVDGHIHT